MLDSPPKSVPFTVAPFRLKVSAPPPPEIDPISVPLFRLIVSSPFLSVDGAGYGFGEASVQVTMSSSVIGRRHVPRAPGLGRAGERQQKSGKSNER